MVGPKSGLRHRRAIARKCSYGQTRLADADRRVGAASCRGREEAHRIWAISPGGGYRPFRDIGVAREQSFRTEGADAQHAAPQVAVHQSYDTVRVGNRKLRLRMAHRDFRNYPRRKAAGGPEAQSTGRSMTRMAWFTPSFALLTGRLCGGYPPSACTVRQPPVEVRGTELRGAARQG